jgi:repressor LexA
MEKLSLKQHRVLEFIKKHIRDCGYPPTVREIADRLGLAGPHSAKKFLDILERKGYVRRLARSSRAIELLDERKGIFTRVLPVVGSIRAGAPLLAVENIRDRVAVDASLAPADGMFLLEVEGDSMLDAHILDGDLALIRPQQAVEQGQIAAVRIGDEATIKYFFRERHCIRLQPAHPAMPPILIPEGRAEVQIIGKVVGIIRRMEG